MIFYFSGTGNSAWIANQIAMGQKDSLMFIPEAMKTDLSLTLSEDEKIGFVFPIYSWGPPDIVLDFIKRLSFTNYDNHYLYFVCSCGDDMGLAKSVILKALQKKGWKCESGFSVIMPNNYVLLPGFDIDSKEIEQKKLSEAVPVVKEINRIVSERQRNVFHCKKGKFAFVKTRLIYPFFRVSSKPFWSTDACTSCKRCEKVCPMNNIKLEKRPVWGNKCTSCLACYHICPVKAVQYGKMTKNKGRYFNPEIRKTIR